jgi:CRP-like cAMP-binding protein
MPTHSNSQNYFLASLGGDDQDALRPHLKSVVLAPNDVLYDTGGRVEFVYFPYSGLLSFVVGLRNGQFIEAGLLGRNGVAGGGAALDGRHALNRAVVQIAGVGAAMEAAILHKFAEQSQTLRLALMNQEQALFAHTQQVAACNAAHELEARLSRWLLQVRDLVGNDRLQLTQDLLSQMLGVQRTSVTLVVRHLQQAGLITTHRGYVEILDREGLGDAACECYGAITDQLDRLTGWRPDAENAPVRPS